MLAKLEAPQIPLPNGWQGCVKSAVVHVVSLAHYAIVYARRPGYRSHPSPIQQLATAAERLDKLSWWKL